MSDWQETHNACLSIFSKFQKNWGNKTNAEEAVLIAREMEIASLKRKIKKIEGIDFNKMKSHGLIFENVTKDCTR